MFTITNVIQDIHTPCVIPYAVSVNKLDASVASVYCLTLAVRAHVQVSTDLRICGCGQCFLHLLV